MSSGLLENFELKQRQTQVLGTISYTNRKRKIGIGTILLSGHRYQQLVITFRNNQQFDYGNAKIADRKLDLQILLLTQLNINKYLWVYEVLIVPKLPCQIFFFCFFTTSTFSSTGSFSLYGNFTGVQIFAPFTNPLFVPICLQTGLSASLALIDTPRYPLISASDCVMELPMNPESSAAGLFAFSPYCFVA